ncbi:ABC transporter permease [Halalkalibacterium halodurans]|uniref:MacB-like periplasmic core domain-containing protein n=1 Tax=Halalkalibacterium halodurans TaxID=86665 RepID=A0A0M0KG64_ALKHA|nr:ABC transporter permease [Halalkalibacterium halodurans]MED3646643.1 ABC transporter permease [Halalkalibacterium halodurans]TPE66983.1 ABC transporter permease [Halalkalibacterium halodurans]
MIENQFILALKDLWRKKWHSLILLIQVTLVLVLIHLSVLSFLDLQQMKEEVSRLSKDKEIYALMDLTSNDDIMRLVNDDGKVPDMRALYNYIFHNESFSAFTLYSNFMFLENPHLRGIKGVFYNNEDGSSEVEYVLTSEEFFNYFEVNIAEGRRFNTEDYIEKTEVTPVVIGQHFAHIWNVGETFTDVFDNEYEVIGILEKGATYINIMSSREIYRLDSMILLPVNESNLQSVPDFDEIIPSAYIVPQDESMMREIIDYAAQLETYTLVYKRLSEQVKHVIKDKQTWIQMQLFLLSLVTLFTLISLIVSLLQFIDKNQYEFGVHYLTGAENKHVMTRIIFHTLPFIIIGNMASFFIDTSVLSTFITLLASILLGTIVVIIPLVKIQRLGLSTVLRWKNR